MLCFFFNCRWGIIIIIVTNFLGFTHWTVWRSLYRRKHLRSLWIFSDSDFFELEFRFILRHFPTRDYWAAIKFKVGSFMFLFLLCFLVLSESRFVLFLLFCFSFSFFCFCFSFCCFQGFISHIWPTYSTIQLLELMHWSTRTYDLIISLKSTQFWKNRIQFKF